MNKIHFGVDTLDNPVSGMLTYIAADVDAVALDNFHEALDALTHKTFPQKYEVISVSVTGRTYDGENFCIVKCDKIFDDGDVANY